MKNCNFSSKVLFSLFLFILGTMTVFSQSKTGTTIGQFLKIEPSSRIAALGNAGVSLSGEASSIFYNPASLGRLTSSDVQFTFNKWLADITYNYASAAIKLEGIGTFSILTTLLNSGEIDVRTVEQPLGTGERYSVSNFALGIGYGLMLTDRVSVGLQVTYIDETIWHSSLNTFALNFGVQYELMEGGVTIGASVSNFGPRASYEGRDLYINYDLDPNKYGDNDQLPARLRTEKYQLPTIFRAGISYPVKFTNEYSLLIAADAMHPNDNDESINIGGELNLLNYILLRGGYRNLFLQDTEGSAAGGLVLGGGVQADLFGTYKVRFDYAWADYGRLSQAHRVTLSIGF